TLRASGGQSPYSWRLVSGALPDGLTLNGSSGAISGTPTAPGAFNFTIEVADATGLKTSRLHTIAIGLPTTPALAISGIPATVAAMQQPAVDVSLAAPYPVALTGRVTLTFVPASGLPDDPAVQFSSGGRSASFTIPANGTRAVFAAPQLALQ